MEDRGWNASASSDGWLVCSSTYEETLMFYEVQIVPVASGGGQWQVSPPQGEGWADAEELVADIAQGPWTLYELGVDTLPEGVEDIRGTVHGAPFRLFALVHDADVWANVQYVGIVAKA